MPYEVFTTSGTWTVPLTADPSTIGVYAWGEGGDGYTGIFAGGSTYDSGAAGGGGAIAGEPTLGGLGVGSVLSFTIGQGASGTNTVVTGGSVTITAKYGTSALGYASVGQGGAAGSNTIAFKGGNGGTGYSVAGTPGGGGGGGSGGSTGAGGTGGNGTAGSGGSAGAAGSGAAGPPSLAGAAGAHGSTGAGADGKTPGSGGAGGGKNDPGGSGAPGQVIIIWSTLNGIGLTPATVSIAAEPPAPLPTALTVTATAGGSTANGTILAVEVLDNAALPTALNGGTQVGSASQAAEVQLTPAVTGSKIYSAVALPGHGSAPTAATGQTALQTATWGGGTWVSTSAQTANTPFTAGASTTAVGGAAALEVTPFGGTISVDASSPSAVSATGATTAETAAFSPPPGKLILAVVAANGGSGQVSMAVSDSFGLTWTAAEAEDGAGDGYAGIWYAYAPANVAFANDAPSPGLVGSAYSYTLTATGGYGNFTWAVASGSLPAGLSLNGSSGIISGTPTTAGISTFTITVTDSFGNALTSGSISLIVNKSWTSGGVTGWTGAAVAYSYGTLEIPVANTSHDWLFVSVSWETTEDAGIAYVADDVRNVYQVAAITPAGSAVMNQVFVVPNARAASTVYVSTSAFARWLTVMVLDVPGLQPGYTVDISPVYAGSGTTFTETGSATQPDFILACGAFQGSPQTVTQAGSGAGLTWSAAPWAGINGSSSDGITQSAAWTSSAGAASPSMQFTVSPSANYGGCMVAVYGQGGLPVNANPAWPVVNLYAAFGYTPNMPTVPPTWTDITDRYLGLSGPRGRSFELDEISAADMQAVLDNSDGALSPGGSFGADLITPLWLVKTWQGRVYTVWRGFYTSLAQVTEFQYGLIKAQASDDFSKLPGILLPGAMVTDALYDQPLQLWPLNEQQGATIASNWSGRSSTTLTQVTAQFGGGIAGSTTQSVLKAFGKTFPVSVLPYLPDLEANYAGGSGSGKNSTAQPPPTPTTPTTGFGNSMAAIYPGGLAGTQDSVWGNTTSQVTSSYYTGTVLTDSGDATLPVTTTGATYRVWSQMYYVPSNTNAVIMALTDQRGSPGSNVTLILSYNGTTVTAAQTAGSHTFTPSAYLFDSKFHLWTVTITTGGTITVWLDNAVLGSFSGSFPADPPTLLQWGGDATASSVSSAGIYTGQQYLAGVYDRVVDPERIVTWYQAGATGFLDETDGTRIQRVLTWARWSEAQAVDPGFSLQQQFNYLGGGYGSSGLSGAIGDYASAGGSAGVDMGAQADVTIQDIANTGNSLLWMAANGTLACREYGGSAPTALPLGDQDYALNTTVSFDDGLGEWTTATSCTLAVSANWSYASDEAGLMTVTGTPSSASVAGGEFAATAGEDIGFSAWVVSPQGCYAQLGIAWYGGSGYTDVYQATYTDPYGLAGSGGLISTTSGTLTWLPPWTPVFLRLAASAAPANTTSAQGVITIGSSPATGTQLYFDRTRLSPVGFAVPFGDEADDTTQAVQDIQYLYNDIAITRNVDQATFRARSTASRNKYFPRIYTRTIYSSVDDTTAMANCADRLLSAFAFPETRVTQVVVDAAANPDAWEFVLGTDIGDLISFDRNPVQGAAISGTFLVLGIEPDLAPNKAQFTYTLAPPGAF